MYNTQNRWVSGLCPSSGILNTRNTTRRRLDLFPSSREGRQTPTLLGLLERANLNHWTIPFTNHSPHLRTEIDPVSEKVSFQVFRIPDDGQILEAR
jgi:hypothetical protein